MARNKGISGKNLGIILLIAVIFQLINIPLISEKIISTIIVLFVAVYLLVR
jgi:uncharacterized membrane protein